MSVVLCGFGLFSPLGWTPDITFHIFTAKPTEEKELSGISNMSSSVSKGRDQGKTLENVSSKFFVGTEVSCA